MNDKFPKQDIVFRIERFGTVAGVVHSVQGNPMANMQVSALRRVWLNGRSVLQPGNTAITDERGHFRMSSLLRGRYRVCVASPQGEPVLPVGYAVFGQRSDEMYMETCLPDARSKALLDVMPGKKLELDVGFSPQTPVEVSGRVTNLQQNQDTLVQLQPIDQGGASRNLFGSTSGDAHSFEVKNVAPGRYWL